MQTKFKLIVAFCASLSMLSIDTQLYGVERRKVKNVSRPKRKAPERITNRYVHKWRSFPTIIGQSALDYSRVIIEPEEGIATAVIFMSSWCVPCQKMAPKLKQMAEHFSDISTRFVFIFSQDTSQDAMGFAKEYKLDKYVLLANHDLLAYFRNPKVPSIYLGDRRGWLNTRWLDIRSDKLKEFEKTLLLMTSH